MKFSKLLIGSFAVMMLVVSCGKQTAPSVSPEDTRGINVADQATDRMGLDQNDSEIIIETEESGPSVDLTASVAEVSEPPVVSSDITLTDWDTYMIVPGDFLFKIAKEEYGNFRRWREIYAWNEEKIGANPNLIYPYHYLTLKRDNKVEEFKPGFSEYEVNSGETLWDIADKLYGDPIAWIILYLDNTDRLNGNSNFLDPGMTLQVRDNINPKA
ncbi:MAG: LysM peptidoglycan-binding domain-containing protein [Candidatus Neomarinimicrobiota bacterium]|nr:LysM peptidoglycan-binding domain-containing protein [Candidatus Neomarinimicrobiota bacterium]